MHLTPDIIRIVRINLGITQGRLARNAGVSPVLLSCIERDERQLTKQVADRIRAALPVNDERIAEIVEAHRKLNSKGE